MDTRKNRDADAESRALEQAYAGVRRPERSRLRGAEGPPDARSAPRAPAQGAVFRVQRDEDGRVSGLRDGVPDAELRALRGKRCNPQATLDLHGLHAEEAARAVRSFIRDQHARGRSQVLIVHGKGLRSEGGLGVLGDRVVRALTAGETSRLLRSFATADESHGGRGALVVALAGRRERSRAGSP